MAVVVTGYPEILDIAPESLARARLQRIVIEEMLQVIDCPVQTIFVEMTLR